MPHAATNLPLRASRDEAPPIGLYVIEGTIEFTVDSKTVPAEPGDSIWVARGFVVTSDAHVLSGYNPGGFKEVIKHLAVPAERRELPPDDLPPPERPIVRGQPIRSPAPTSVPDRRYFAGCCEAATGVA